jgi:hypothetical protein
MAPSGRICMTSCVQEAVRGPPSSCGRWTDGSSWAASDYCAGWLAAAVCTWRSGRQADWQAGTKDGSCWRVGSVRHAPEAEELPPLVCQVVDELRVLAVLPHQGLPEHMGGRGDTGGVRRRGTGTAASRGGVVPATKRARGRPGPPPAACGAGSEAGVSMATPPHHTTHPSKQRPQECYHERA